MLTNLGPVLVMVMPVGYAVSEEGSYKYNYMQKSLDSYIPIEQRETEKDNEEEREGGASFCRSLHELDRLNFNGLYRLRIEEFELNFQTFNNQQNLILCLRSLKRNKQTKKHNLLPPTRNTCFILQ